MAGTFSQLYVQIIFAVNGRQNLITPKWKDDLYKYISGIITNKNQKSIIVNGAMDHVHAFIGLKPNICISDMARDIKNNSSNYINKNKWVAGRFSWQEGYGSFSYSHSQIENVYHYIKNQEVHHKRKSFRDEYLNILKKFDVKYNDEYLFDWIDKA